MKCEHRISTVLMALAVSLVGLAEQTSAGTIVPEVGDAGELPGTSQMTVGTDAIDSIVGDLILTDTDDIDMFAIFIADLSVFSATTVGPGTEFLDTKLFLFDGAGMGIAANDDTGFLETNATISAGSVFGPAGLYYLAVAELGDEPVSGSGEIFPLFAFPGEVVGPIGPGGADPIIGWDVDFFSESLFFPFPPFPSAYEITLTGVTGGVTGAPPAVVPEPSAIVLLGIGCVAVCGYGRRRNRKAA